MYSRKQKLLLLKFFSLFSIVRGYNILILVLAQYLASIYILAPHLAVGKVLFDLYLFMLVMASSTAIAGGYIINNFYDSEKDLINRPQKTMLDKLVTQKTKLSTYFLLNFLSVFFASYVSFRAVLFFSAYIFAIWFYSHKLKRYPFIGNITAAVLTVVPFFAIFIYYGNLDLVIFVHASFLFLIISMRELVKDLENLKGDLAQNYRTIPVVYGEMVSKKMLTVLSLLTLVPIFLLITRFETGHMNYFFYGSIFALFVFLIILWNSAKQIHYLLLHNILKFIIIMGVFSVVLIDVNMLLEKLF